MPDTHAPAPPAVRAAREELRVRGDVRRALREVYVGAETLEVDALLDQLAGLGLKVVRVSDADVRCHACGGTGVVELGADEWAVGLQLPKHAPRRRTRQIEQTFADALTGQVAVVWTPKRDDPSPGEAMYYDHTDRLSFVCPTCADVLPTGGAE